MWHLKPTLIPLVVWAFGSVKKGTKQYLEQIFGFPSLTDIQKTVLTSTAHILRKTLFKSIADFVTSNYIFIFTINIFINFYVHSISMHNYLQLIIYNFGLHKSIICIYIFQQYLFIDLFIYLLMFVLT